MQPAPVLRTERLILTGPAVDDFSDSAAMWADQSVTRYIGRPSTREEVWGRLVRYMGHWAVFGFGYWTVRESTGGRFVGEVGFANTRRELEPSFDGEPEAGWALAPWAQGRGYGGEAVAAITAWGDANFAGARTVCIIAPDNLPSMKLAARAGYREYARTTYYGDPTIVLERPGPVRSR